MKRLIFVFVSLIIISGIHLHGDIEFEKYFEDKTMRVDFFHMADKTSDLISVDQIHIQGIWAGPLTGLIDPFEYGQYFIKVYDIESGKLIYSRGYHSYCGEYKTTDPAARGIKRNYHESALFPCPKNKVRFVLEQRDRKNRLNQIFSQDIDPASILINRESPSSDVTVVKVVESGDPHVSVDLVFIGEGYQKSETDKFKQDLNRMTGILFDQATFKNYRNRFNITGVLKPSEDSGCDEPTKGSWKRTAVGATFNALNLPRYMLTEENRAIRNISAAVPCDTVVILVNSKRYGGGGIYNFYSIFSVDNARSKFLFLHEFGHAFAGLADEYYTSDVAYNEFYPPGIEPLEPNITALLDKTNLKWKHLMTEGTDVPTGWGKEKLEKQDREAMKKFRQMRKKMSEYKKAGAGEKQIMRQNKKMRLFWQKNRRRINDFYQNHPLKNVVGAFEGAGYSSEGLYRPMLDCIMFSSRPDHYCQVCSDAVVRMIKFYTSQL